MVKKYQIIAAALLCSLGGLNIGYANFAPVVDAWQQPQAKQSGYKVKKGDTLYSIAWAFNQDYRDLAVANHLKSPYHLSVGQLLQMHAPKQAAIPMPPTQVQPLAIAPTTDHKRTYRKKVPRQPRPVPKPTRKLILNKGPVHWQWPVRGRLIQSKNSWLDKKGINIAARYNAPVLAAATGQVVYAGSGVPGYGKLIIIKHNNSLLSAYALNHNILVHSGSIVRRGQKIATVGRSTNGRSFLHFEIRKNGRAVNPKGYLNHA